MYYETFKQMKKHLGQLDKWLETSAAFADTKKFDPKNFMGLRIIVDQFPFSRQVQATCDTRSSPRHDSPARKHRRKRTPSRRSRSSARG